MRPLVLLGATGSIGRQALEVADRLELEVRGVAARRGSSRLAEIARRHPEALVAVASPSEEEREALTGRLGARVRWGREGIEELAALPGSVVLNAVVGSAGLAASVAALRAGNRLALANKESLVAGGPLVLAARDEGGGELIPVDSEHSALFQCLLGEHLESVRRVILTASGGPFRGWSRDRLEEVTVDEALEHPTWRMGPRITIDSATLLNKGLEVIEAHHLFGLDYDRIDVVVHPQSVIHSMVEFVDGSLKAQLGEADMRIPIQYALTHPERAAGPGQSFVPAGRALTFEEPDLECFPALALAYRAGRRGGTAPATLNAADEVAVRAFLEGRVGFMGLVEVLERTLERASWGPVESLSDVERADAEARALAAELVGSC